MSKLANQWIELFRTGTAGDNGEFTNADLDQIVSNYRPGQPNFEEAPITIGHPTGPAPAWGWMESLKRIGSTLLGKPKDVQPEFEEMVEKGLFKKRSVGLVKRDNGWTLNHVAWLGAKAPAIKGLADCQFAGSDESVKIDFEESDMAEQNQEGVIAGITAWLERRFPSTAPNAPATFTEADVKRIAGEAVTAAVTEAVKPLQTQIDDHKKTFAETQTSVATVATQQRADAAILKVKNKGAWVPAFDVQGVPALFAELAKAETVVQFGEGDKKVTKSPLDVMVEFMEGLGPIVPADRLAKTEAGAGKSSTRTYAANADPNSVKLHEATEARAKKDNITYAEAMGKVVVEMPELTLPGGTTAGAV